MRMGAIKSSLISKIGFSAGPGDIGTLRVAYKDGAVFDYANVPFAVFRKLVRSKNPGQDWLKIRDRYKFKEA